jgi:hypothetical protein
LRPKPQHTLQQRLAVLAERQREPSAPPQRDERPVQSGPCVEQVRAHGAEGEGVPVPARASGERDERQHDEQIPRVHGGRQREKQAQREAADLRERRPICSIQRVEHRQPAQEDAAQ